MSEKRFEGAGKFVWHDLMTTDCEGAIAFYTKLFGWKVGSVEIPGVGAYKMISSGERSLGGFVAMEPTEGLTPHWIGYVTVDDVDAATERAEKAGGQICVPGTDIPGVGRFAVLADPTGGVTSPFTGGDPEELEAECPPVGVFCWDELLSSDTSAATSWYTAVYGWTTEQADMGEMGVYTLYKHATREAAGMLAKPEGAPGGSQWVPYVTVADVDASTGQATELGGKVMVPPMDVPNIGRFSVIADPAGALFGLYKK